MAPVASGDDENKINHDKPKSAGPHEMIGGPPGRARVGHAHDRQRVEIDAAVRDIGREKRGAFERDPGGTVPREGKSGAV